MDDITREKAQVKVDKMQVIIGYTKEILDPKLLNQYYEGNKKFISWNKIQLFFIIFLIIRVGVAFSQFYDKQLKTEEIY